MGIFSSDSKIIEGCKAGKRIAQRQLFDKFSIQMLGVCLRYARNKSEAEDIMQEGFIKVFLNIKKFRGEGSFEGWIKRIMINTSIHHLKKNLKHDFHLDISELDDKIILEEVEETTSVLTAKELMKLIQALPDGYKIVFNLYVFEKYSHKEIAELLKISENTSKSQLSRARSFLKQKVKELIKEKSVA